MTLEGKEKFCLKNYWKIYVSEKLKMVKIE